MEDAHDDGWSSTASGDSGSVAKPVLSRKFWLGCLIAIGATVLLCIGVGYQLVSIGMAEIDRELLVLLKQNTVIQEQIGEINELELDWSETFGDERENWSAYDIQGSLGSGSVSVELLLNRKGDQHIADGLLVLDSLEEFDLVP